MFGVESILPTREQRVCVREWLLRLCYFRGPLGKAQQWLLTHAAQNIEKP